MTLEHIRASGQTRRIAIWEILIVHGRLLAAAFIKKFLNNFCTFATRGGGVNKKLKRLYSCCEVVLLQ